MITEFIKSYTKLIASQPDAIEVEIQELSENYYEVIVYCDGEDLGKLIGKSGNMINALKTIINGSKAKDGKSYKIQVFSR